MPSLVLVSIVVSMELKQTDSQTDRIVLYKLDIVNHFAIILLFDLRLFVDSAVCKCGKHNYVAAQELRVFSKTEEGSN